MSTVSKVAYITIVGEIVLCERTCCLCVGCGVWGVGCGVWGVGCGLWMLLSNRWNLVNYWDIER